MRRWAVMTCALGASVCVTSGAAVAGNPLDKPAFTAKPEELLAAAKSAPSGSDAVILRNDRDITFDAKGRATSRTRLVFVVLTRSGADDWADFVSSWRPFYQDKPSLRARVIDPSGSVAELDQKTITDHPETSTAQGTSETRELVAALPRLSIGSVVEEEITGVDREPLVGGGGLQKHAFGTYTIPTSSSRVSIAAPGGTKLHLVSRGLPATIHPQRTTANGTQRVSYTVGAFPAYEAPEPWLPGDHVDHPYVEASVVPSWQAVARGYRALTEEALAGGPAKYPADVPKTASVETAYALTSWLHQNIRFNDVYARDVSYKPSLPAETMHRGTGDEQELAVLLVSLLRQAGMHADLVLVDSGPGTDIDRDVPALDAVDRLLVRVKLASDLWINPIDDRALAGQISWFLQGRRALVIADDTTDLITTPLSRPEDNAVHEVRTFAAAESGAATITEVSRELGMWDREHRGWIRTESPAEVRKRLTSYMASLYSEATLQSYSTTDVADASKPFEITTIATGAKRVFAVRDQIDVHLFPQDSLIKLPDFLNRPGEDEPARKHDLLVFKPHVYEIENRIVVPPGFSLPPAAPERKIALGPWSIIERQKVDGNIFVVSYRFETTKLRLTAAEVTAVQEATRALHKAPAEHLVMQNTAVALLDRGKAKEALAEVNRLIKLHPKEGIHHGELARIYLAVGAGEAARREARRAVEVEPNVADHHVVLAWVLSYDLFGRRYQGDFDRAGAIAELQKARKLEPKHAGAPRELGQLLMRDAAGHTYGRGADLAGAAEAFRAAYALDATAENGLDVMRTLLFGGKAAEAEKFGKPLRSSETRDSLYIAAVAASLGGKEAIREASALPGNQDRTQRLGSAAGVLMLVREYDAARELTTEANLLPAGSPQAQLFARLKRSTPPAKVATPQEVAVEALIASMAPRAQASPLFWDAAVEKDVDAVGRKSTASIPNREAMTQELLEDITRSLMNVKLEGDAKAWRVEVEELGKKGYMYLATDKGGPKVIGMNDAPEGVGRYVLRLLAKSDEATATRLLDWMEKDIASRTSMFLRVWGTNLPRTRQAMNLAAAVLSDESAFATTLPTFEKCGASTTDGQMVCDLLASRALYLRKDWSALLDFTDEWSKRATRVVIPLALRATALNFLGKHDEAEKVTADLVAAHPDDHVALYARAESAVLGGDLAEAVRRLRAVTQQSSGGGDLNNLAWFELYEGSDLDGSLADAQKALQLEPKDSTVLHTLASIEAERGSIADAYKHLRESMAADQDVHVTDAARYVEARILEQVGLTAEALAMYRIIKPNTKVVTFPSVPELAARRIKVLTAKK